MNRVIRCTLAMMCLVAAMVLPVLAATNLLVAELDQVDLNRGNAVVVTVRYQTEEPVSTVSALLKFDETVFELVDGKCAENTGAAFESFNEEHAGLALLFSSPKSGSGDLGTFTLRVKDDAIFGEGVIVVEPVLKNGAETLTAQSVELRYTVFCNHNWSNNGSSLQRSCSICKEKEVVSHNHVWGADGLCVTCGTQNPNSSDTEPVTKPTAEANTSGDHIETEPLTSGHTVSETGTSEPTNDPVSLSGDQEAGVMNGGIVWVSVAVALVLGGCVAIILLKKR